MNRWQFSLRSLLIVMTALSPAIALAANYPIVAMMCLVFVLPFLTGKTIAHLVVSWPNTALAVMVIYGMSLILFGCHLGVLAYRSGDSGEWFAWIAILFVFSLGACCFAAACYIPDKPIEIVRPPDDSGG